MREQLREKIAEVYFHWRVSDSLDFKKQTRPVKVIAYAFADQILALVKEAGLKSPTDGTTRIFFAGRELNEDEYQDYLDDWAKANGFVKQGLPDVIGTTFDGQPLIKQAGKKVSDGFGTTLDWDSLIKQAFSKQLGKKVKPEE